jgi:hypothetical protein
MCLVAGNIIKHFTLALLKPSWVISFEMTLACFNVPEDSVLSSFSTSIIPSNLETIRVTRDLDVPDELEALWSFYILDVLYIAGHSEIRWVHCLERIERCQEFALEYSKHL